MNKKILLAVFTAVILFPNIALCQQPSKVTTDITINELGNAMLQLSYKYDAANWDVFTKMVGTNNSILKSNTERAFPKYVLKDFDIKQNSSDRVCDIKFTILGIMDIDKNGNWSASLDSKDPDITKLSDKEFLLMEAGNPMKIHLPDGTSEAKIEKNSFGKAMLTYPASEQGSLGTILLVAGLGLAAFGGFLLFKKMTASGKEVRTIYTPARNNPVIEKEINQKTYPGAIPVQAQLRVDNNNDVPLTEINKDGEPNRREK